MSRASIGAKVGTLIVDAIKGKKSAAATATAYAKTKASKTAIKAIPKTKFAEPIKNVRTKPARKPVGNPPNMAKSTEEMLSSASRGGVGRGPLGKAKTARKFSTPAGRDKVDVRQPARMPDEPARGTVKINSAKTVRVVKVAPKKVTSSSTSSVKQVPRKAVTKGGLETRGAKPTTRERINRARDLQWDKAERFYDAGNEMQYTGLVSSDKGMVAARGAGKKNMRKRDAIRAEANKNLPIEINSARPFKSTGADSLKANNARALKAANKPVSKNNRNRFGDGEMSAYLKSAKPARANRTRLGNTANKKGK